MSFAYLPLYTGDYLRDTRHLTPLRHGVYLLLLIHCWDTREPVPLDEQEAAGIANCRSADEVEALRYVLNRYFICAEDGWYNERMVQEIERAEALSKVWSNAGKRGAEARIRVRQAKAKPRLSQGQASATTPPPTPYHTKTTKSEALALTPPASGSVDPPAAAPPPVISIPLNDKTEFPISASMVAEWETLYGECDVMQTLREIRGWNLANPNRRKTRTGILNHINRWLAKEHNRG